MPSVQLTSQRQERSELDPLTRQSRHGRTASLIGSPLFLQTNTRAKSYLQYEDDRLVLSCLECS
jgi:hypothetical protein